MRKISMMFVLILSLLTLGQVNAQIGSLRDLAVRHEFFVGAVVQSGLIDNELYSTTLATEFNLLAISDEFTFSNIQPTPDEFNFAVVDRLVAFGEVQRQVIRGRVLISANSLPEWVTPDGAAAVLENYIRTVVGRYAGRVDVWDVASQALSEDGRTLRQNPWQQALGDDYVASVFRWAHEADPNARLYYSDYLIADTGVKADAIYNFVNGMVANGVPVSGVALELAIQMDEYPAHPAPALLWQEMDRYGALGLQVDIVNLAVQLRNDEGLIELQQPDLKPGQEPLSDSQLLNLKLGDQYRVIHEIAGACFLSPYCNTLVMSSVDDASSPFNSAAVRRDQDFEMPVLFDVYFERKPAFWGIWGWLEGTPGRGAVSG
jgi:GH35 family endo-1,4-beta-xylanase